MGKLISSKNLRKNILRFKTTPTYTEDALFLMSLSFIILVFIDPFMRYQILDFIFDDGESLLAAIFAVIGIVYSIYCAFSVKEKSNMQKFFMIWFAVFVNVGTGIFAGVYLLRDVRSWLIIFPILNLANAILLFFLFRIGKVNEKSISDEQAKLWEIAVGSTIVIVILVISHFLYRNYWAITFSIAVGYATSINESIKNLIFNKQNIKPKSLP